MSAGNKLLKAAAGNAGGSAVYVDDVFSTFVYEGRGGASGLRTIDNGIDLAGEGGLIWTRERDNAAEHLLIDTERGLSGGYLSSDSNSAANTGRVANSIDSFTSTGYKLDGGGTLWDRGSYKYVSWTFRKQEKFFDIVTYTGSGSVNHTINHNLGSVPGMIIFKRTGASDDWGVYHRSHTGYLMLNRDQAGESTVVIDNLTSTSFRITRDFSFINEGSNTYVAYLFAHDEQNFGEDSDQAIIKCESYTGNGNSDGPTVNVGFEPQWVLIKNVNNSDSWHLFDNMREYRRIYPSTTDAEQSAGDRIAFNSTGFKIGSSSGSINGSGNNIMYVAIRRPHKPASEFAATDLFTPVSQNFAPGIITAGFPIDLIWHARHGTANYKRLFDRLRGATKGFYTDQNNADITHNLFGFDNMTGFEILPGTTIDAWSWMMFRRAPGFLDVVNYTGTGSATTVTHNLGVAPEMMILKNRDDASSFQVYHSANPAVYHLELNNTNARSSNAAVFNSTTPTSSVFSVGTQNNVNGSGKSLMAYLFASVDGVSKVGSYTGTGNDVNVDCGFSSGARLVIAKRSDSTGGWYLWDSARGIVAGNDSYFLINDEAAQVTNTDYIDPLDSGFTITSSAPAELNASGGTYVFLAIA